MTFKQRIAISAAVLTAGVCLNIAGVAGMLLGNSSIVPDGANVAMFIGSIPVMQAAFILAARASRHEDVVGA